MARKKSIYRIESQPQPETRFSVKDLADEAIVKIKNRDQKKIHFATIAEKLAKSSIHYKNWYLPELRDKFPYDIKMKLVDKMFPYADGGMLLIDEPRSDDEFSLCERKKVILKELKYRYIVIEEDSEYYESALELEKWDKDVLGHGGK